MRATKSLFLALICCLLVGCAYYTADLGDLNATPTADQEMISAIQKAHDTLGIFTASLATPAEDQLYFSVRVRFSVDEQGGYEDLWLENLTYDGQSFTGTLGNDPAYLEGLELGDQVTAPAENVIDWMIVEEGRIVGGFVIRVLRERMTLSERLKLSRDLSLPIEDPA
jgi:uncharacterized protein YegJ (DUF2314 family)